MTGPLGRERLDREAREADIAVLRDWLANEKPVAVGEIGLDLHVADVDPARKVDHVDPETGEVTRVAGIQHVLISHCAQQPGYLTGQTSLVNAVFRVFLSNGNTPLSPEELGERIGRPAQMILRTLTGPRVYKGIRPYTAV